MKILFIRSGIIGIVSLFLFYSYPIHATASNLIDISGSLTKTNHLFSIENIKPGDWADRELIISNASKEETTYDFDIRFVNGSKKFFHALTMEIRYGDAVLFHNKLHELSDLPSQTLAVNGQDNLNMRLSIPKELGNEYQGLSVDAEIIITAKSKKGEQDSILQLSTNSPISADKLPNTASYIFNFLLIGSVLLLLGSCIILLIKRKDFA